MNMTQRCAIYSRCSTSKGQTVDNQIIQLREISERKGLTTVQGFSNYISGAKGRDDREGFDNPIKGATRKDFDTILVWSVGRLSSSLQDLVSFLNDIHSVGCDLYIHQSGIDTQTPAGK